MQQRDREYESIDSRDRRVLDSTRAVILMLN